MMGLCNCHWPQCFYAPDARARLLANACSRVRMSCVSAKYGGAAGSYARATPNYKAGTNYMAAYRRRLWPTTWRCRVHCCPASTFWAG